MEQLKKPTAEPEAADRMVRERVEDMLAKLRQGREDVALGYARDLDKWEGDPVLSDAKKASLIATVPQRARDDIRWAYDRVRAFAEAQAASIQEFEMTPAPGIRLGQRLVPCSAAGCYVPGGRYAHIASAIMSVTTAKVAGVPFVAAASPPRGTSIDPSVAYALDLAGADVVLEMGGVHGLAAMAFGLFGLKPADILVGPGNAYVAEAKRQLFGEVGIDVFAGPTESAVIADETADPVTVAVDLASQAEHGTNSPVWLFTTHRPLAEEVMRLMPRIAATWPSGEVVAAAWENHGEVILCESREEMVEVSDRYASEHLQVIAKDLEWWKEKLVNYGSLFLGAGSTVSHGDKCAGTNHILPTKGAARYSGGLNVMKFIKVLTWQEIQPEAALDINAVGSRISRLEGMDGHARACDLRLRQTDPGRNWDFEVAEERLDG
ncbi:MAG: histidinol dehydrogenase [Pseudomonadota bacterium]